MEPRNFILENINMLKKESLKIAALWEDFQKGNLTKEAFEDAYCDILYSIKECAEDELNAPNNGCKYSETAPACDYFKNMGY